MISKLENGYDNVELLNLNNLGNYSKAKIILNSKLLSYTNITGIYSPFTGEANINTNQPSTSIPFTILHEMAHQRGYGIGLAYTKYIIEAHGGNISVESIPGKGSLFICKFPLK